MGRLKMIRKATIEDRTAIEYPNHSVRLQCQAGKVKKALRSARF